MSSKSYIALSSFFISCILLLIPLSSKFFISDKSSLYFLFIFPFSHHVCIFHLITDCCVKLLSRFRLCDPMDCVVRQAPLSMKFSRQEYWSELPFPSPGDLPNQGSNPGLLHCRQIFTIWVTRKAPITDCIECIYNTCFQVFVY